MEDWGYARVSTDATRQAATWEHQSDTLTRAGATNIFKEECSAGTHRPIFEDMLDRAIERAEQTGESVNIHITKMDRAFRDIEHAIKTVKRAYRHGVQFILHDISNSPMDPTDAAQSLHFHVLAAIGQIEKDRFAERRAIGIAKAKKDGKYKGRQPTARAKTPEVLALKDRGFKAREIAKQLGIGVASVYRILADAKNAA
jgi:DNA invertase Pin-like site-specific DNA recombinase